MTRGRPDKSGLIRGKPGSWLSGYIGSRAQRLSVMNKPLLVLVVAVVLGTAVLPTAALPIDGDPAGRSHQPNATTAIAPGEAFAGAVGVQRQELDGEVEARAYGRTLATARSDNGQARIVADRTRTLDRRLDQLRERQQALQRAHDNGSISDGRFHAEMAQVAARLTTVQRLANQSRVTARSLPEPVRAKHSINVTAVDRLRTDARAMAGPAVARLARRIAGPSLNRPLGRPGPGMAPSNVTDGPDGPGLAPGNGTDGSQRGPMTATNRTSGAGQSSLTGR